jgi:hypothetical protein
MQSARKEGKTLEKILKTWRRGDENRRKLSIERGGGGE